MTGPNITFVATFGDHGQSVSFSDYDAAVEFYGELPPSRRASVWVVESPLKRWQLLAPPIGG